MELQKQLTKLRQNKVNYYFHTKTDLQPILGKVNIATNNKYHVLAEKLKDSIKGEVVIDLYFFFFLKDDSI